MKTKWHGIHKGCLFTEHKKPLKADNPPVIKKEIQLLSRISSL